MGAASPLNIGAIRLRRIAGAASLSVLGGAAAAQAEPTVCADPGAACAGVIDVRCLDAAGAGALSAGEPGCSEQRRAYRACLAQALRCRERTRERPEAAAAPACDPSLAKELWSLAESDANCAGYAAFLEACPDARRAAFARARLETLACGGAPAAKPRGSAAAKAAQRDLKRLGYYRGAIDGLWGGASRRAMRAFQTARGIAPADGALAPAVQKALAAAEPEGTTAPDPAPDPGVRPPADPARPPREGVWTGSCDVWRASDARLTIDGTRVSGRFTWETRPGSRRSHVSVAFSGALRGLRLSGRYQCTGPGERCETFGGAVDGEFPDLFFALRRRPMRCVFAPG